MKFFQPHLVNAVTEDPGLFIKIAEQKNALLVDCGELYKVSKRNLKQISKIFISHTHIDHFIGFDKVIRANLGATKTIEVFGPRHIGKQIHSKLLAYSWNLLTEEHLDFHIYEINAKNFTQYVLNSKERYQKLHTKMKGEEYSDVICQTRDYYVKVALLEHKIPSLAYAFIAHDDWSVDKKKLDDFDFSPGPWLGLLKKCLKANMDLDTQIQIKDKSYSIEQLRDILLIKNKGQKISYVTDTLYSHSTQKAIIKLVKNSDVFYCECHFSQADQAKAEETCHLTAYQAGILARNAKVKKIIGFHYSPKYSLQKQRIIEQEYQTAFKGEKNAK